MRTTVEIQPRQRAALMAIAVSRNLKGFSTLIQEALDLYLDHLAQDTERIDDALAVLGSWNDDEGEGIAAHQAELRRSWR